MPETGYIYRIHGFVKFSVLNIDFLSRRDRNQGSQGRPAAVRSGGAASEDEALCGLVGPAGGRNNNCYLLVISTSALILLLVLAYFTSSLHSRIVTLEQQLRWKVDEYYSEVQTKMFCFQDEDSRRRFQRIQASAAGQQSAVNVKQPKSSCGDSQQADCDPGGQSDQAEVTQRQPRAAETSGPK